MSEYDNIQSHSHSNDGDTGCYHTPTQYNMTDAIVRMIIAKDWQQTHVKNICNYQNSWTKKLCNVMFASAKRDYGIGASSFSRVQSCSVVFNWRITSSRHLSKALYLLVLNLLVLTFIIRSPNFFPLLTPLKYPLSTQLNKMKGKREQPDWQRNRKTDR